MTVSVGILSIGDMGMGIARLLQAHSYRVLTVGAGRRYANLTEYIDVEFLSNRINSQDTLDRIRAASIEVLPTDQDLVIQSDYILSVVPPRDSLATAQRIVNALQLPETLSRRDSKKSKDTLKTLYFFDLNATSPRLMRELDSIFAGVVAPDGGGAGKVVHFIDEGIIGGPPSFNETNQKWKRPSIVVSGPVDSQLLLPTNFPALFETLNMRTVGPKIGSASALKLSFASLTKGLTALSLLSFTTAQSEGVWTELVQHLEEYSPMTGALATRGAVSMPPKAYRWVEEMRSIGEAFDCEGHWDGLGSSVFDSFAKVYARVAEQTVLGGEKIGKRVRGRTVQDVAEILAQANSHSFVNSRV